MVPRRGGANAKEAVSDPATAVLIAIVSGAAGIAGTIAVTWVGGGIEFRHWQRQQRLGAYSALLHAADQMMQATRDFGAKSVKEENWVEAETKLQTAFDQLSSALDEVEIVASTRVVEAAVRLHAEWLHVIIPGLQGKTPGFMYLAAVRAERQRYADFLQVAREDLGIKGEAYPKELRVEIEAWLEASETPTNPPPAPTSP